MTVGGKCAAWGNLRTMCGRTTWVAGCVVILCVALATSADDKTKHHCKFPQHKKAPDLTVIAPLLNKRFQLKDNPDSDEAKFSYSIGICIQASSEEKDQEAGVIQTEISRKKKHVIGKFTNATVKIGTDWALLEYRGGEPYGHHCQSAPRVALIMITCDPDATTLEKVNPTLIEEENSKLGDCYYLFELSHSCICNYKAKEPLVSFSLSVGSILVIVFVSLCVVYLVGGLVYNRFVLGAKGMEQIPNFGFWMDFGNLQADGCNLVCRTGRRSESRSYKGVGDDQLVEEDDHDEHLLPM